MSQIAKSIAQRCLTERHHGKTINQMISQERISSPRKSLAVMISKSIQEIVWTRHRNKADATVMVHARRSGIPL